MRETASTMVSAEEQKVSADARFPWRSQIRVRLNQMPSEQELRKASRPAAVLVAIIERAEPTVMLTKRTDDMPTHAGQISFPGGRFHADDESFTATALREFEEEMGVAREYVELAGYLDPFHTANSGFLILPVVGFLHAEYKLAVNPREVAAVFEAPLSFLADPKNRGRLVIERDGLRREFTTIEFEGHTIWGATAAMLFNLAERLRDS
jgi:8-oxo-dGTP pyrophosphatase MutT (NUDIX family)